MSNKVNKKNNSQNKKKIPWKKKTGLQKGAVITNWMSVALLVVWFISLLLKLFGVLPAAFTWGMVWGFFGAAAIIGFAWFFFVIIMISVFGKK